MGDVVIVAVTGEGPSDADVFQVRALVEKLEVIKRAVFHSKGEASKAVERQLKECFSVCEVVYPSDFTQLRSGGQKASYLGYVGAADVPCVELESAELWDTVLCEVEGVHGRTEEVPKVEADVLPSEGMLAENVEDVLVGLFAKVDSDGEGQGESS